MGAFVFPPLVVAICFTLVAMRFPAGSIFTPGPMPTVIGDRDPDFLPGGAKYLDLPGTAAEKRTYNFGSAI